MKKLMITIWLICLFLPLAGLAETRTIGLINEYERTSFWEEHPDVKRDFIHYNWREGMDNIFLNTEGADLLYDYTDNVDLELLRDSGMLADLSQSSLICEAVERMHPDVRRLITDEEGHIYALPLRVSTGAVYWMQDAWAEAGFTEADVPQSYTELLDFLEAWIQRIQAKPEKNLCISRLHRSWNTAEERDSYVVWMMTTLRCSWELQQRHAGKAVNYDDPAFIALAERTMTVGRALNEAEPKVKKRQSMQELFSSQLNGFYPFDDNGLEVSLSHTLPLRITRDQPALTRAYLSVCMVRRDTDVYDVVLRLLESYLDLDSQRPYQTYGLYTDTQPFAFEGDRHYSPFTITESWLKDYYSYTGTLMFCPFKSDNESRVMDSFYLGQITAQELALGLNEFIGYEEPF